MRTTSWATVEFELAMALQAFDADQILILQGRATGRYLQVYVEDGPSLHAELSSNQVLPVAGRFSAAEVAELLRLGWREPSGERSPNFSAGVAGAAAIVETARLAVCALADVMGVEPTGAIDYSAFTSTGTPITLPQLARALQPSSKVPRPA